MPQFVSKGQYNPMVDSYSFPDIASPLVLSVQTLPGMNKMLYSALPGLDAGSLIVDLLYNTMKLSFIVFVF